MLRYAIAFAVGALLLVGFGGTALALNLMSPAFAADQAIPKQHTCDDANRSPELRWTDAPTGTKALALLVDDPDAPAGTWVHWVLYDLPADAVRLPEGVPANETAAGGTNGTNSSHKLGYSGPCPPPGKPHRYLFKLYALDAPTGLKPGASKEDVLRATERHILARATLIGTYGR